MIANITTTALAASASTPVGKSSVLNIRIDDLTKSLIAGEAIRDGRSMSQITLRAIQLGLAQMLAPTPTPVVEVVVEAPKAAKAAPAKAAKAAPTKAAKAKAKAAKGSAWLD